ncbi:GMC oxidoreductase [Periconia macrospinosa]|uniref:GMC oxidoreductase n=1 Tax=Periconia macrospinosa TaxID=97972 RepID=A0A2V1D8D4_9PLEO|nr:GMC oxidoreductase [Periconia macrospinosa]
MSEMSPASSNETIYDYIIVGGGTAGLVLANRLSEDKNITIVVLEAGTDATADPRSVVPAGWANALGSDLDWNFATAPQTSLNGRRIGHHQGKALGGSSSINVQALVPFSASDIDVWESKVGLEGWNFATLAPYLHKAFSLTLPDDATVSHHNASWAASWAAEGKGPVKLSFPPYGEEKPTSRAWTSTFENLGVRLTAPPFSGKSVGAFVCPTTIDSNSKTRSSSASSYWNSAKNRENLTSITSATVKKIVLEYQNGTQTATGVEYIREGIELTLKARREVIVSAGALNSPKILELSGIGDPTVLKNAGIPLLVENKFVGANLQDHVLCGITFEASDGVLTGDEFVRGNMEVIAAAQKQYIETQSGPFATSALMQFAYLPTMDFKHDKEALSKILTSLQNTRTNHPLDNIRAQHLSDLLTEGQEGTAQFFTALSQFYMPGEDSLSGFVPHPQPGNFVTPLVALSHPLSTGHVHIASSDYTQPPIVDHNYLSNPIDLELHARHVRYIEEIARTHPFAEIIKPNGRRLDPIAYLDGSLEKAKAYVKAASDTNYHSVGTLAMAPREKGGVVNARFQVYGVSNLRVVDASVFPLIPQSNTQSLVYVVAERAADLIKSE